MILVSDNRFSLALHERIVRKLVSGTVNDRVTQRFYGHAPLNRLRNGFSSVRYGFRRLK